jgi:hypothetical protein
MGTLANILMALAIVVLLFILLYSKITQVEQTVSRIAEEATEKSQLAASIAQESEETTKSNVAYWNYKTSEIEQKMMAIANSIQRMEDAYDRDHKDLVDIRQRYILYREPSHPNGGVQWSEEIKASEDAIDG